jgi:hypothetical protein
MATKKEGKVLAVVSFFVPLANTVFRHELVWQ